MTIAEYRELTKRTLPNLGDIMDKVGELIPPDTDGSYEEFKKLHKIISDKLNYSHMALGLASEIKELVACIGTELRIKVDKVNLSEELGDFYWYLANFANMRDLPLPEDDVQIDVDNDMCLDYLIDKIGDIIDLVKRFMAYNSDISRSKELEAIYNVRVALLLFEKVYELDGDDIRTKNIAKLQKRYPERFTDYLAVNRNIEEERKTLEG